MNCLSCKRPVHSKSARLWQKKILLCPGCAEFADKAKAELDASLRRAGAQALMFLEQRILAGGLLEGAPVELPGFGKPHD